MLTSCNFYKLALDYADTVIIWEVDRYFDISRDQKTFLKSEINKTLMWVRVEKSSEIISTLSFFESSLKRKDSFTLEDAQKLRSIWDQWRVELMDRNADSIAKFLSTLTEQQWSYHWEKLKETNQKWDIPLKMDEEDFYEYRYDQIESNFTKFFGPPSNQQIKQLLAFGLYDRASILAFSEERRKSQEIYYKSLNKQHDVGAIASLLRKWAQNPTLLKDEKTAINYKNRIKLQNEALVTLIKSLDAKQIDHCMVKIQDLKKAFTR